MFWFPLIVHLKARRRPRMSEYSISVEYSISDVCDVIVGRVDFCAGRDAQRRRAIRIQVFGWVF